jgi:hypothetical protein
MMKSDEKCQKEDLMTRKLLLTAAIVAQRLALVRLLEVIALLDEAGGDPTFAELMLRTPEATDEEFRAALITKSRQERPSWRLKE